MNKNTITNKINRQNYFVSVVSVKKSISIPTKVDNIPLGNIDFKNITIEAAVFEEKKILGLFPNLTPKPQMVISLDDGPHTKEITNDIFLDQIISLIQDVDLNSDLSISTKLENLGYKVLIHEIWNLYFMSNIKHIFVFKI